MGITEKKLEVLQRMLDESTYTVALCGSGVVKECGQRTLKTPQMAYEVEEQYGVSPEETFTTVYYNNRTAQFFEFYKEEILKKPAKVTETARALKKMEEAGKLQCIIDSNIYQQMKCGGCKNVIALHGSIYENTCPHCGKIYSMEYMRDSEKIPRCESCGTVIRPGVKLFGEMMNSTIMSEASSQVEQADVLLLLGTSVASEVYSKYLNHFEGRYLILIHKERQFLDERADLLILEEPRKVLEKLKF